MTQHTPTEITGVRLDDLITAIRKVHDDPLDQLTGAMSAADHLGEVGDSLIGHFVDQARRAGASWSDIGTSMGVSKQAAQKRFVNRPAADTDPFSRFTPRARSAVAAAHNQAIATDSDAVTPTHLAHALTLDGESLAARVLHDAGADITALADPTPPATRDPSAPSLVPFDDAAKTVLEDTVQTAHGLGHGHGHGHVGTEHLLLSLFTDPVVGARLTDLGLDRDGVSAIVVETLSQIR
ncbi:Clp protease N-terminal domain-containing protein [Gordonia sp. NB41Y]|uniref:Clp protease N-terminal domain-containing protein n=1 Tax=Gordonia sp. NB41Y TaxID=875808 RepID=UPI00273C8AB4|nr:Clp protease N-terminal domain-containing protein [Gordonia sp. NB41Y]WLP92379.1 Clp protease N-terminal domain-containing protein [Gordonia sp. NB41Y]